jgi:hypothetical protein
MSCTDRSGGEEKGKGKGKATEKEDLWKLWNGMRDETEHKEDRQSLLAQSDNNGEPAAGGRKKYNYTHKTGGLSFAHVPAAADSSGTGTGTRTSGGGGIGQYNDSQPLLGRKSR